MMMIIIMIIKKKKRKIISKIILILEKISLIKMDFQIIIVIIKAIIINLIQKKILI